MHLITPLLAFVVPALASFQIPHGQPEGVYSVETIDGKEVHTLIRSISTSRITPRLAAPANLEERDQFFGASCAQNEGGELNHSETDRANSALDGQCGGGATIGSGLDYYSIVGCTVAYACNYSVDPETCRASDRQQASRDITRTCGLYRPGWVYVGDSRYPSYGYENFCTDAGNRFCGRGV